MSYHFFPETYDELLKVVSEEEIMLHYFGDFQAKTYFCPFKAEKTPSFKITYYKGRLKWIRFGLVDRLSSPIDFVMMKYSISFPDALRKIYLEVKGERRIYNRPELEKISQSIKYADQWLQFELDYWEEYHINKKQLEKFNIFPCTAYWIGNIRWHYSKKGDPLYVYIHSDNSWTGYRPLAKKNDDKFRKYNISGHIMGLDHIPKNGKNLFITSSYKDILVLDLIGIPSIAPHTEKSLIDKNLIEELKSRFDNIYVAYDNDETGVSQSIELSREFGLKYWNVPKSCIGCKDPSDLIKLKGIEELKNLIYNKIC
jgi:hypothetical protein